MSRIGDTLIILPDNVTVDIAADHIVVKGPKGELDHTLPKNINIELTDNQLKLKRTNNARTTRALHGLTRSLVNNMVTGVSLGYSKKLELVGTGYRAKKQGDALIITVGFSHPVEVKPVSGIELDTQGESVIVVSGIDKQKVGHMAAKIRDIRKPEPYKGKGIRYHGEIIRRKAGKATKVGSAS
jgi:large subunit ribosomal protein L6